MKIPMLFPAAARLLFSLSILGTAAIQAQPQAEDMPKTRAEEIQAARRAKQARLAPDVNSSLENGLNYIKDKKVLERITAGAGGLRAKFGGLVTGSGFAFGPEFLRDDLADGELQFRAAAQYSTGGFQKYDIEFNAPRFARDRLFLNLYSVHHNYPELQFYGLGPDSTKGGRTNYRLEDTAFDGTLGVNLARPLRLAASTGYVLNNVGPGTREDWASTERVFSPAQLPGIDRQTDFFRYGAFLQLDYRDIPGGPRSGGNYFVQVSRYRDQNLNRYDFDQLNVELQQYIPFFNERRVIALRGRTTLTDTRRGQVVPFYMLPYLGGAETLRGYRPFRFYGNNSLLLNAEYRYEIFSGLDMAIFADAGKVTQRRGEINFSDLESDVGFGFRFNVRNNVFLRLDTAFSHEGFQVFVRFDNIFRRGPYRTSSGLGDF
jgi:outer membrane protein assembly factor BamA